MEFLRVCQKRKFNNVVVSLKSSNTRVMVYAYRLLALKMFDDDMHFALHLGVTEAGAGEDGRIKSAVGIGALMLDGLGDTIRVSLTEHPAKEIPVAMSMVNHFSNTLNNSANISNPAFNPYQYQKRETAPLFNNTVVIADIASAKEINAVTFTNLGFTENINTGVFEPDDLTPDAIFVGEQLVPFKFTKDTKLIVDHKYWENIPNTYPLFSIDEYLLSNNKNKIQNWVQINSEQLNHETIKIIKNDESIVLVAYSYQPNPVQDIRMLINTLIQNNVKCPVIIQQAYTEFNFTKFQLKSAADTGLFFIDGLADGLWLKSTFDFDQKPIINTAFAILQASRTRITKTEYISCPSCGRTLFDLEKTLEEVKDATTHLKGLKIAVMGCIVNGPGEMADADFGYVGAGPGKVSLYKGKTLIKRNIETSNAVQELLALIESSENN